MMSASEEGEGVADIIREAARILQYKSDPNADKGRGGKKIQKIFEPNIYRV